MPLSFLSLPPEIRVKIYRILLRDEVDHKPNVIDPVPWLYANNSRGTEGAFDLLPLLRTCQVVRREAIAILYGHSIFSFDDDLYSDCISNCGITWMYTFLRLIGPVNRSCLQDIHIHLCELRYCYYTNEVIPGEVAETNGGKYLGDAFELLSQGHFLRSIVFTLDPRRSVSSEKTSALASHLFRPIKESKLLRQLQKIKGLGFFKCQEIKPTTADTSTEFSEVCMTEQAKAIYRQLQTKLTRPKNPKPKTTAHKLVETEGTDIITHAVKISNHRKKLQKKIDEATAQVQEWKTLQSRIEETTQQIQEWEEAKLAIDDGIKSFQQFSATITPLAEPDDSTKSP
ncbi:MAG: hypothetical protein Q9187_008032 [Circinaria calcarea]